MWKEEMKGPSVSSSRPRRSLHPEPRSVSMIGSAFVEQILKNERLNNRTAPCLWVWRVVLPRTSLGSGALDLEGGGARGLMDSESGGELSHGLGFSGLTEVPVMHLYHARIAVPKLLGHEYEGHALVH